MWCVALGLGSCCFLHTMDNRLPPRWMVAFPLRLHFVQDRLSAPALGGDS